MLPFVTFIIITKNSADRISKCLKAIKEINYPKERYEIIVVDGGSEDDTLEIVKSYGARIVISKEKNQSVLGLTRGSLSKSRNAGLFRSRGEYIAYVDDDAMISREWLKTLINKGFKDQNVAGATGFYLVPESSSSITRYIGVLPIQQPQPDSLEPIPFIRSPFKSEMITQKNAYMVSTKACCYRKSALLIVGGFDENIVTSEDPDINARLIKKGYKFAFVPEAKACHQPRQNIRSFIKQQIRDGFGQSHNLQMHIEIFEIRWFLPVAFLFSIMVLMPLSLFSTFATIFLGFLSVGYLLFLLSYGLRAAVHYRNFVMLFGVPFVGGIWQLAWGLGFIYGLVFKPCRARFEFFKQLIHHVSRNLPNYLLSYYPSLLVSGSKNDVYSKLKKESED